MRGGEGEKCSASLLYILAKSLAFDLVLLLLTLLLH